jgi:hypothetical protein
MIKECHAGTHYLELSAYYRASKRSSAAASFEDAQETFSSSDDHRTCYAGGAT